MTLRLGTRGSALAVTQSQQAADAITRVTGLDVELVRITTLGDVHTGSLASMPQPGVFVSALREALLRGEVDVIVHSMKDLPSEQPAGLVIAAVPRRVDPRDVLIARNGLRLDDLPPGSRVGTGSPRRRARVRALRPDLAVVDLRGNVDTRIRKVHDGELDAVVLAAAGLERLGRLAEVSEYFAIDRMLPAPAQGALAIEVAADSDLVGDLAGLDDFAARMATIAEREVLTAVAASCATAIAAHATVVGGRLRLLAEVFGSQPGEFASFDGECAFEMGFPPAESAIALGHQAGQALLDAGARDYVNPR